MINFNNAAKGQSRIRAQVLGNLFDGTEIFFVVLHALAHPHDLTLSAAKGVFSSVAYRRCHHQQYLKCVIWLMGDSQENIGQIKNVRPLRHSSTFLSILYVIAAYFWLLGLFLSSADLRGFHSK